MLATLHSVGSLTKVLVSEEQHCVDRKVAVDPGGSLTLTCEETRLGHRSLLTQTHTIQVCHAWNFALADMPQGV